MPEITSDRIHGGCTVLGEKLAKDKPKYIDVEVALKTAIKERKFVISEQDMLNTQRVFKTIYSDLAEFLYSLPRADVVEVVRCGECMHRGDGDICPMRHLIFDVPSASYIWIDQTLNDGFCSFGVRKEGALWMQKKE